MKIFVGIILIVIGILLIKYRYQIHNFTGEWGWAIKYLGGTINAIVLIGGILVFAGAAYPFGVFDGMTTTPGERVISPFGK